MSSSILKKHLSYSQVSQRTSQSTEQDSVARRKANGIRKQNKSVLVNKKTDSDDQFKMNKSFLELATEDIMYQQEKYASKLVEYGSTKPVAARKNKKGQKTSKASRKQINNILKLYKKI
jgi:hypothetical protein